MDAPSKYQSKSCQKRFDSNCSIILVMAAPNLEPACYRACASRRACVSRSPECDRCDLVVKLSGLLLVVRFHYRVNNRSCGFRTPSSVFDESCDDNFRIAIRREPDKPGVVLEVFPLQAGLLAHNLCCTGF